MAGPLPGARRAIRRLRRDPPCLAGPGPWGRRLEAASGTGVCCWPWSRSANGKPGARRSLRCSPGLVQGARRRAGGDRSAAGDSRRECPCPAIPAGPVRAAGGLSFIRRIMSNTSISCRPALGCAVDSCRSSYGCQAPDGCGPCAADCASHKMQAARIEWIRAALLVVSDAVVN
jgi:hypothetical protein